MRSSKAATSPPGWASCPSRSRLATAPSSARYRSGATATCASLRASSVGRADQATELGASRAQALDRGRQEAAAPQRSCDRTCQQTGQDCLERSGSWPKLRGEASHGVSRLVCVKNRLLPAEVCERTRRDGGSVFPARANTGDPFGRLEAFPLMRSHAR